MPTGGSGYNLKPLLQVQACRFATPRTECVALQTKKPSVLTRSVVRFPPVAARPSACATTTACVCLQVVRCAGVTIRMNVVLEDRPTTCKLIVGSTQLGMFKRTVTRCGREPLGKVQQKQGRENLFLRVGAGRSSLPSQWLVWCLTGWGTGRARVSCCMFARRQQFRGGVKVCQQPPPSGSCLRLALTKGGRHR